MREPRYPTLEEFWRRLELRQLEPDLVAELRGRTNREEQGVHRLPPETTSAVAERLLPGTIPPLALAAFVDTYFDRQLGRADEKDGLLPRQELIPAGFRALDDEARTLQGRAFHELPAFDQDALLQRAERGDVPGGERFDSSTWFRRVRSLMLLGLGSDPRGMVFMGYPGPSYEPGHVWLDEGEVAARAARKRGYLTL